MALIRTAHTLDPMDALLTVQRELERVLDNPLLGFDLGVSGRGVFPPINVFSDADGYVVRVEVPGVPTDRVVIDAQGQTLTISGRREATRPEGAAFHRRERESGEFRRSIQMPRDVDVTRASATCTQGVLTIRVPRREETKPRQITITPGAQG
jgi:HSP20 family protein